MYMERGGNIFPPASDFNRLLRLVRQVIRTAYERKPLEDELLRLFGETTFGESRLRLCIPAFKGRHGEPRLYKTPHHPDYKKDRVERMVRVGLATSAAPTFFESLPNNGYTMVDGGNWANNPVMNGLADALSCFAIQRNQVQILSLGYGETAFSVDDRRARGGILHWANDINAAMRAQSLNALGQAYLLVGKNRVKRLDAPAARSIALDDYRRAKDELPGLARTRGSFRSRDRADVLGIASRGLCAMPRGVVLAVRGRLVVNWIGTCREPRLRHINALILPYFLPHDGRISGMLPGDCL